MKENRKYTFKKIHITVPEEMFNEIKERGMFPKIDEIVIELLEEYLNSHE